MAESIEKDMRTYLRSLSAITTWVGSGSDARVYWTNAPDAQPTMPYIVYTTIAVDGEREYVGDVTPQALLQFSVFHDHQQNGLTLANAVFDALDGYYGSPGDKSIIYISADGPRVIRDPDYDNVYQYIVDATVRYER